MQAPVLTTDRLVLRAHSVEDFDGCCALWADPVVVKFIGGKPSTQEEVWARILRYAGLWSLLGYGYFLATDRQTGDVVGEIGLADFHRDCTPPLGDTPEAGWVLLPRYHGQGLAREGLNALLDWADRAGMAKTVCLIDPENLPSQRLAKAVGYIDGGRAVYKGHPSMVFQRFAPAMGRPS